MESAGNANKPYIFVSFTGEDEENVNEFCAELRRLDINAVTYESKDSEAAFGKNFADWRQFFLNRTQDKRCLAVVCFFTRQYFAHRATLEEICMLLEAADQFPPVYGFCPAGKRPDQFIDEIADYSNKNRGKNPFRSGPDHTYFVRHEERLRKLFDGHNIVIDSAADLVAALRPLFPQAAEKRAPARAARGAFAAATPANFLRKLRPDAELERAAREGAKLAAALRRRNTGASVDDFVCGDAVFRFYLRLAEGTPPGQLERREKDIACDMRNDGLRFGFDAERNAPYADVPRAHRRTVTAEDFLRAERAEAAARKGAAEEERPLRFPLGRTVEGRAVFCDLDETPHWLIGAANPQEAESFLFTAATWLTKRYTPARVRLLLVQLHGAAFAELEKRPHLLGSPLSDPREAIAALYEVKSEMERRYTLLYQRSKAGRPVGHIGEYNAAVSENERLPAIVVLIDDVTAFREANTDLFGSCADICNIGRAAGIHLVAATRSCSPRDISGLFKYAFGGRIAFRLSDFTESLNLLEEGGAESLLHGGDLLFKTAQTSSFQRAQAISGAARPARKRPADAGPAAQEAPLRLYELAARKAPFPDGLPFALGKAGGTVLFGNFRHTSSWLIEGGPGAGKSTFLRAVIADAACRHAPARLCFVLADGGDELGCFDGLPHLLWPIAADGNAACDLLRDLFDEFRRREELFRRQGTKNILSYNAQAAELLPDIVLVADGLQLFDTLAANDLKFLAMCGAECGIRVMAAYDPAEAPPDFAAGLFSPARVKLCPPASPPKDGAEAPALGEFLLKREGDSDVLHARSALVTYGEAQQIAAYLKNQAPPSGN